MHFKASAWSLSSFWSTTICFQVKNACESPRTLASLVKFPVLHECLDPEKHSFDYQIDQWRALWYWKDACIRKKKLGHQRYESWAYPIIMSVWLYQTMMSPPFFLYKADILSPLLGWLNIWDRRCQYGQGSISLICSVFEGDCLPCRGSHISTNLA